MDVTETTLEGTIQPDGSLILDGPTSLPPGRVEVVVRPATKPQANGAAFLRMLREFEESKLGGGTAQRSITEREAIRREMEEELTEMAHLQEDCRQRRAEAEDGSNSQ